jgi:uncharacterized protein (TIGR00369 family)
VLGAVRDGGDRVLPPYPHLLGGNANPAFHGGAIGALLATVAQDRITKEINETSHFASISIRYLRAARSTLRARASVRRVGRRIGLIDAEVWADGVAIAVAECIWIRSRA